MFPGSNNYLHDSCSDTEGGINDNDSFGSRISSGAEAFKPVKEELEMDEEYFRLMNAATRFGGKAFDGRFTVISIFKICKTYKTSQVTSRNIINLTKSEACYDSILCFFEM